MLRLINRKRKTIKKSSLLGISSVFLSIFFSFGVASAETFTFKTDSIADLFSTQVKRVADYQKERYQLDKKLSTNLFGRNVDHYNTKEWSMILQGVDAIKKVLNTDYASCDLSNEEISSVLFFVNYSFSQELRKHMRLDKLPTRKQYNQACEKLTACFEGKRDQNLNKKCDTLIDELYTVGFQNQQRKLLVEEANLGKDKYWNSNTEDASYDLMHDISVIGKIFFEDVLLSSEKSEILFYRLPTFNYPSSNRSGNGDSQYQENGQNRQEASGNKVFGSSSSSKRDLSSKSSSGDGSQAGASRNPGSQVTPPTADQEINAYIKLKDPLKAFTSDGEVAFVNHCVLVGSQLIEEAQKEADLLESSSEDDPASLPESVIDNYVEDILAHSNQIKNVTRPNIEKKATPQSAVSTDSAVIDDIKKELEQCVKKCNGLRWDERQVCKLQCLCAEYISPRLPEKTIFSLLEEGALKIRICTIPSKVTLVTTDTKKLLSIESILAEIWKVIDGLYESGELTTKVRTREFWDTSQRLFKFSDNVSFIVGVGKKSPRAGDADSAKKEEELHNRLKDQNIGSHSRNRYVILDNYEQMKQERTIQSEPLALPEKQEGLLSTQTLLAQKRFAKLNLLLADFLDYNVDLLYELKASLKEVDEILTALDEKR